MDQMSGFERGQALQLELDRHGGWTAQVQEVMADRIAVAAIAHLPVESAELSGTGVQLATATPRGILRAPGIVLAADRSGLMEISIVGDPVVDQRRTWVRIAASLPGLIAPRAHEHPPLHTFTLDVSAGGVLIAGAGPSSIGTPVTVTVKLPERDPLQVEGRIARRTHIGNAGIVFEGISEAEREDLIRWIFERQRRERAAARGRQQ
jgi:hypothetical protein